MNDTTFTSWTGGRALKARHILYDQLPIEQRLFWTAILEVCTTLRSSIVEIHEVILIHAIWQHGHRAEAHLVLFVLCP